MQYGDNNEDDFHVVPTMAAPPEIVQQDKAFPSMDCGGAADAGIRNMCNTHD
jgi:hypothetical protein